MHLGVVEVTHKTGTKAPGHAEQEEEKDEEEEAPSPKCPDALPR